MEKKDKVILIVEDDEILLRALYMQFKGAGYTLASAEDGEVAMEIAQRIHPDLILLDLLLPKKDGFEVLHDLKSDPKLKDIPVIVLSNLGSQDDIEKTQKLGAVDYFVKADTDLVELETKIVKYLT